MSPPMREGAARVHASAIPSPGEAAWSAVRPPGHGWEAPAENAPCWPAAMAGEAHPVPSRTRKLSPLAPMVLRISPWESRTPPPNKGRFRLEAPSRRLREGAFPYARAARAGSSALAAISISRHARAAPAIGGSAVLAGIFAERIVWATVAYGNPLVFGGERLSGHAVREARRRASPRQRQCPRKSN